MIRPKVDILAGFQNDDGLIKMTNLEPQLNSDRICFKLKNNHKKGTPLLLYPSPWVRGVIDYLVQDIELLKLSSIRVSANDVGRKGAPVFGPITLESAIKAVRKEGFVKSKFYILRDGSSALIEGKGVACYLIVHLGRFKESNGQIKLQLEAWSGSEVDSLVHYIHCIFSPVEDMYHQRDDDFIEHLDGAIIKFNPSDKDYLFHEGKKCTGVSYEKQFRLDGKIPLRELYKIAKIYFPIDTITDEYFGLDVISSDNSKQRFQVTSADLE